MAITSTKDTTLVGSVLVATVLNVCSDSLHCSYTAIARQKSDILIALIESAQRYELDIHNTGIWKHHFMFLVSRFLSYVTGVRTSFAAGSRQAHWSSRLMTMHGRDSIYVTQ